MAPYLGHVTCQSFVGGMKDFKGHHIDLPLFDYGTILRTAFTTVVSLALINKAASLVHGDRNGVVETIEMICVL